MGGSRIFLSEGESITVEDLLKGVCVSSGNDAAVALAEKTAGVTELFVERMNNRARELGMQDTHFVNCTGLPAEGHVTSAWDIAVMSGELSWAGGLPPSGWTPCGTDSFSCPTPTSSSGFTREPRD